MNSTILIVIGVAGLFFCGAVRLLPQLKGLIKMRPVGDEHAVVDAYCVLCRSLVARGEDEQANHLRTKILPAAIQIVREK